MNTVLSRLNTIFAFTLSVMAALTFLCFLSTFFNEHQAVVGINTGKVIVCRNHEVVLVLGKNEFLQYVVDVAGCMNFLLLEDLVRDDARVRKNVPDYSASREKNDLGFVIFDLQTDLSSIFNWNVKQLFLYLSAEYETKDHKLNQVVIWDKIIKRGENAVLDYRNMNTKYYFWDYGNGLKSNKNVTLSLSWNVIPNAGTLPKIRGQGMHRFQFPGEYSPNRF